MRAVVQRVTECAVSVDGEVTGRIAGGLLVYVGFETEDEAADIRYLAEKIVNLRIFLDEAGKMNRSLLEVGGELLVVSQFTLHADVRRGRRPYYGKAAAPERAERLYHSFLDELRERDMPPETGRFGAHMEVSYTNSGPVTILLDSKKQF